MLRESELERRIRAVEDPANQGTSFDGTAWFWLCVLGIALPIGLIAWGWL